MLTLGFASVRIALAAAAVSLALATPAASLTMLTDPGDFSASAVLIDFESTGANDGGPIGVVGPVSFELSTSTPARFSLDASPHEFGPGGSGSIDNGVGAEPYPAIRMAFDLPDPVFRFGFELRNNAGEDIVTKLLLATGGQLEFTIPTRADADPAMFYFYGFENETPFTAVIFSANPIERNGLLRFDNLRIDAVPEPATAVLLGGGLLGLAGFARRRRSAPRR